MANYRESITTRYNDTYTKDDDNLVNQVFQPSTSRSYETTPANLSGNEIYFSATVPTAFSAAGLPTSDTTNLTTDDPWGTVHAVTLPQGDVPAGTNHIMIYRDADNWAVFECTIEDSDGTSFHTVDIGDCVWFDGNVQDIAASETIYIETATSLGGISSFILGWYNDLGTAPTPGVAAIGGAESVSQPSGGARYYETGILVSANDFTGLSAQPAYDSVGGPASNTIDGGDTDWSDVWGISVNGSLPSSGYINLYDDASNYVVVAFTRVNNAPAVDTIQFGEIVSEAGSFHPVDEEEWNIETATTLDGLSTYEAGGTPAVAEVAFVPPSNLSYSDDVLTVTNDVSWNGQINGSDAELVVFNKTIVLQDNHRLYGSGNNGSHWWFVNCNFIVADSSNFGGNDTRLAAGPASNVGNGSRTDTITGTKSNDCTFNMFNCNLTFNSSGDFDDLDNILVNGDIVLGTAEDVEFVYTYPDGNKSDLFPMNGSDWDTVTLNSSTSNISKANGYQLFSEPDKFDGISLINCWGYTGCDSTTGGIEVTYDGFSAVNTLNPSDNDQDGITLYEVAGFGDSVPNGTCTNFVSPRADLKPNGVVRWRRLAGNSNTEYLDHSIILRQDIRRQFIDASEDGRQDVRMYFNTNVELEQRANVTVPPDDTDDLPAKSYLYYETDTDGFLTGTYDFNDGGSVTSQRWGISTAPIRLPLQWLRTGDPTDNDNVYTTSVYDFESDITEFSLWGERYTTYTRNEDQVLSTADANGYFISPNDETHVDPDDAMMDEYGESISTLTGKFTASNGSLSWNDIGAGYKYAAWSRTIPLDNWGTDKLNGTSLDVSGSTVNKLRFGNATNAVNIVGTDILLYDAPTPNGVTTINFTDGDHVDTVDFIELDANNNVSLRIDGGDVNINTIKHLEAYATFPTEFEASFSVKNAKLTGSGDTAACTVELSAASEFYVFHNIEEGSNVVFTGANASDSYTVISTGTTDVENLTTSATNVSIESLVEITLDGGTGHTADADNVGSAKFRLGSSVSDAGTNGTLTTVAAADISVSGSTYTFRFRVPKGDDVYAAIAIDGFEIEGFTGVGNTTRDLTPIASSRLSFTVSNFNVWGDVTVAESEVTVTTPTGNANTDAITVTIAETGNSVLPTQATDAKFRRFFREYIQQNDGWMDGVLLGYIAGDFIGWGNDNLVVADNQNERLKLNRSSDLNNSWRVGSVVLDESGNDLFDTQTTGTAGQRIFFTPNPTGASISQIQAVIDAHEASVKGSANRDLTETYNQAKGAKNAAYGAG